ncbi:fatty acid synthase-like [Periplaneta americana]|uniref:fatty acid synthase-like n=1 Tax=Periplaneta americana TaxID=6978 RepID=UPI0037E6F9D2
MLQVVTEKCAFNGGLVAVNSFSLAGSGVHLLLRWNDKVKVNNGAPTDRIPRLMIASGRTEEAVDYILKELESKPLDAEFVQLIQDLHSTDIPGHTYRGYSVITQDDKRLRSVKVELLTNVRDNYHTLPAIMSTEMHTPESQLKTQND